jgi:hypothetical protein
MNVFGKMSRSSLLNVVFPLEEAPLMPTTRAFLPGSTMFELVPPEFDYYGENRAI